MIYLKMHFKYINRIKNSTEDRALSFNKIIIESISSTTYDFLTPVKVSPENFQMWFLKTNKHIKKDLP